MHIPDTVAIAPFNATNGYFPRGTQGLWRPRHDTQLSIVSGFVERYQNFIFMRILHVRRTCTQHFLYLNPMKRLTKPYQMMVTFDKCAHNKITPPLLPCFVLLVFIFHVIVGGDFVNTLARFATSLKIKHRREKRLGKRKLRGFVASGEFAWWTNGVPHVSTSIVAVTERRFFGIDQTGVCTTFVFVKVFGGVPRGDRVESVAGSI